MKKRGAILVCWVLAACVGLAACRVQTPAAPTATAGPPTATTQPEAASPIYLAIIWHQHQPLYFKDPETGVYEKPWVRLHAAKDYVDMAAILEGYPAIRATYNLTPSLLRQLQDLEAGTLDLYRVHTETPADQLDQEDKAFIEARFFDINPKIVARFPRYQEIANDRSNSARWDAATWRDLQVLFNLAWTDPDFLAVEPLAGLVAKGEGFSEADKAIVFGVHDQLVTQVIPLHRRLQESGQIEVTTTPFFHPILPLLVDSNLAREAVEDIALPARYTYGLDAIAQLELGVSYYEELFGTRPSGLWPAEGAVAQEIVDMVARQGILWMASDEEVLARSLGLPGFSRDSEEVVQNPQDLYHPYRVRAGSREVYIVFRDKVISDNVGFTYSGTEGSEAAEDFINRILAIREALDGEGSPGPFLVSVILDGENAWEHYPNDGKEFLHSLYTRLEEEQAHGTIVTVTPTEFLRQHADQPALDDLWAGSWVSPDYLTWIGEEEENRAWDYLGRVRAFVAQRQGSLDEETRKRVMDAIYTAEGSDWFWWYGSDQNSGDDESFDLQFRRTLQRVYDILGVPFPDFLSVPIIPQVVQVPDRAVTGLLEPTIDGAVSEEEWGPGGYYDSGQEKPTVARLWYGFDTSHLYLRADASGSWSDHGDNLRLGFYLRPPTPGTEGYFSRLAAGGQPEERTLLGFGTTLLVEVILSGQGAATTVYELSPGGEYEPIEADLEVATSAGALEIGLPYDFLGKPEAGFTFKLRMVAEGAQTPARQIVPESGPAGLLVPDLGLTTAILQVTDPQDDDHGPGTFLYPLDSVFSPGAYDILQFDVAEDDANLIFHFSFAGNLNNDWGAPNGMGIHALDVYIDAAEGGERLLFPGRNAALPEDQAWDVAVWAEGWTPGLFTPGAEAGSEPARVGSLDSLSIVSDPGQKRITIRVPKTLIAEALGIEVTDLNPADWGYLGVALSQEGFPSPGVWRVRDILPSAQQWRGGGAPDDTNHTRILDLAWPAEMSPSQEEMLSGYTPSTVPMKELTVDSFPQVNLIYPK